MRLLLIDDHAVFAESLKFFLAEIDSSISCTTVGTIAQALLADGSFDLILLDLKLPDSNRLDGLLTIRNHFHAVPVALLSGEEDTVLIREAIAAGAMGFIPKSETSKVLVAAMRLVLAGGTYLPPHAFSPGPQADTPSLPNLTAQPSSRHVHGGRYESGQLTGRQLEVLMKAVQGKPNKVIARETNLAEGTVKAHLSAAFRLINVTNRTEAVFKAAQLGLTPQSSAR